MRSVRFIGIAHLLRRAPFETSRKRNRNSDDRERVIKRFRRVNQWMGCCNSHSDSNGNTNHNKQRPVDYGPLLSNLNPKIDFYAIYATMSWVNRVKWYLQLNLVLLYCYLCKILINRLAIRAHSVHVVWMPAISMLPPIFATDFCRRSLMPEIDPCSSVPIWKLLLGICSLRTPANCK